MWKLEVWDGDKPLTFSIDCPGELTGEETSLILTIRKQGKDGNANRLYEMMFDDSVHENGLDFCIMDGANDYCYYGYNLLAVAGERSELNNDDLNFRVTFRDESADEGKKKGK